jgi:metal-responsive CopG/Arc/MetJ family transcriptional regulator
MELKVVPSVRNSERIVNNVIDSYEIRIQDIESLFSTSLQILEGFQEAFLDTKQERNKINTQLRDTLARNESLRRKDFDNMMQGILSIQDQREKEIRNLLHNYLNEQKEMAQALRNKFGELKVSLVKGKARRVEEFQALIKEILDRQEVRKKEVVSRLEEFQKEQKAVESRLKDLLAKGRETRIRDFKYMLKEIKAKDKERLARRNERKKEVRHLLGKFKKERDEAAKNWRTMQIKLAYRRAASKKGINLDAPKEGVEK